MYVRTGLAGLCVGTLFAFYGNTHDVIVLWYGKRRSCAFEFFFSTRTDRQTDMSDRYQLVSWSKVALFSIAEHPMLLFLNVETCQDNFQ